MAEERVTHAIGDNTLIIKKDALSDPKEYVGLDVDKIIVGVKTSDLDGSGNPRREIVRNSRGLNEARVAVEAQEIYNRQTRRRRNWFILDLETGKRGWFPGCVIKGDIAAGTAIKAAPDDSAETLDTAVEAATVAILDIDVVDQEPLDVGWYRIRHGIIGYVKTNVVSNIHYANPGTLD